MKTLFLALLISSPALASQPSPETLRVTRALVNSPEIVAQLHKNNSDFLTGVEITELKPSVTQFELVFERNCFCLPSIAKVSITEDLTPTHHDAPPIYKSSIVIKDPR